MTPYKEDIFRELKKVLAKAKSEELEQLLSDIANGAYCETAETRAGSNDNQCNVTNISTGAAAIKEHAPRAAAAATQLSDVSREKRRAGYSS